MIRAVASELPLVPPLISFSFFFFCPPSFSGLLTCGYRIFSGQGEEKEKDWNEEDDSRGEICAETCGGPKRVMCLRGQGSWGTYKHKVTFGCLLFFWIPQNGELLLFLLVLPEPQNVPSKSLGVRGEAADRLRRLG